MSAADSSTSDAHRHDADERAARLRDDLERATEDAARMQSDFEELLADPDVIQEDRDAAALLLEHARRQLDAARAAVEHLDAGAYGRCAKCGNDIGEERLAALPDVTTCVSCAG